MAIGKGYWEIVINRHDDVRGALDQRVPVIQSLFQFSFNGPYFAQIHYCHVINDFINATRGSHPHLDRHEAVIYAQLDFQHLADSRRVAKTAQQFEKTSDVMPCNEYEKRPPAQPLDWERNQPRGA